VTSSATGCCRRARGPAFLHHEPGRLVSTIWQGSGFDPERLRSNERTTDQVHGFLIPERGLHIPLVEPGTVGPCPVAPDALQGIKRQQTNRRAGTARTGRSFPALSARRGSSCGKAPRRAPLSPPTPAAPLRPRARGGHRAQHRAGCAAAARRAGVPRAVTVSGAADHGGRIGGVRGVLLDMTHEPSAAHRPRGADRAHRSRDFLAQPGRGTAPAGSGLSVAPLNLTSSVGGTLGVGGIDVNSARLGCSADQALALQVVTPTGDIVECSDTHNAELFQRVILGYGQFGVITEATLRVRRYTPLRMHYFYYASLSIAIEDLQLLDRNEASDYSGILTIMDCAVNVLVAFDSNEREAAFMANWRRACAATASSVSACACWATTPCARGNSAKPGTCCGASANCFPSCGAPSTCGRHHARAQRRVFARRVKFWGSRQMVIPDLATSVPKFVEAVERGNAVCRKYFPHYTLYLVGIRLRPEHRAHYEMSCIPPDAEGWAMAANSSRCWTTGCTAATICSRSRTRFTTSASIWRSYYRFGGMMKGYIRRVFGDALVDRQLALKRAADPAMILNRHVIF